MNHQLGKMRLTIPLLFVSLSVLFHPTIASNQKTSIITRSIELINALKNVNSSHRYSGNTGGFFLSSRTKSPSSISAMVPENRDLKLPEKFRSLKVNKANHVLGVEKLDRTWTEMDVIGAGGIASTTRNVVVNICGTPKECIDRALVEYRKRCPGCRELHLKVWEGESSTGNAYTDYDNVIVPKGKKLSEEEANHEVGHAIRYMCNGDYYHFKADAAKYRYARTHGPKSRSSLEFSFNEGWALFWQKYDDPKFTSESDMNVSGEVANALKSLFRRCGSSYTNMVQVLCENPGRIYTFWEFRDFYSNTRNCS